MKKYSSLLIFILLLGGGLLVLFYPDSPPDRTPPRPRGVPLVNTVPARNFRMTRKIELTGSVQAFRIARLATPAEGPIQKLRIREGDAVKAGDMLMEIGRTKGIEAILSSYREELRRDEEELSRVVRLVEKEVLPRKELEAIRAKYERAKSNLASAEQESRDYTISAPWDGIVFDVKVQDGDFVVPRGTSGITVLAEIYDPASLVVRAAVPEKYAAEVAMGMAVDVTLDAYPDKKFSGVVSRVYPYLDRRLRTRTVEVEINNSPPLLPGMFVRLELVFEEISDAIAVPSEAVLITPQGEKVIFLLKNGKAMEKAVKTGIEDAGMTQIVSGLGEGETVIVEGNEGLRSGTEVRLPRSPKATGDKSPGKAGEPSPARPENRNGQ